MTNQTVPWEQVSPNPCLINPDSTDDQILAFIDANVQDDFHFVGTTAFGTVVDENCHVIGINNLAIVGNSVYPRLYSAHSTCSSAAMIGANCALKAQKLYGI
jgi:choline dehydrogenase-like flavoprotein